MAEDLGKRVTRGLAWSGFESFGGAAVTLAATMVMARLVTPEDYGLMAVLQIFIAIGLLLVESGFSTALVRLSNRTRRHEATVLAFNIGVSLMLYGMIFLSAPRIADFYGNERLASVTRVYALVIPLNAVCVVQHARLTSSMRFGSIFAATGSGALISSLVAVWMAWKGLGVWALVFQQIIHWSLRGVILWLIQGDNITLPKVYKKELKELFGFSWKLLMSSLIANVSNSLYGIIIGRMLNIAEAGLFFKSRTLASFPAENGTLALQRVSFPALCDLHEDRERLMSATQRIMGMSSWMMFPVMIVLSTLSEPAVRVILGDRWLQAIPLFSLICLGFVLYPAHSINLNILNVFGRSDIFLRLEIIKALLSLGLLIVGLYAGGMTGICFAFVLQSVACLFINGHYSKKYCGFGIGRQIIMFIPIVACSALSALGAYWAARIIHYPILALVAGIVAGTGIYLAVSCFIFPNYIRQLKVAVGNLVKR